MSKKKERPNCLVCSTPVKKTTAKFCSSKCCAIYNISGNKTIKPKCGECGKEVSRNDSKFCSRECNSKNKYDSYIERWLKGEENGIRGGIATSYRIHKYIVQRDGEKCRECGWAKVNEFTGKIPLRLDHIDGNWKNNHPTNLRLLCPNCDSLTSTYCALNKGKGRPYFIQKGSRRLSVTDKHDWLQPN